MPRPPKAKSAAARLGVETEPWWSGSKFVQSEKFLEFHGGKLGDISFYGQDKWARRQRPFGLAKRARRGRLRGQQPKQSNPTTRRLAIMNLALRGIEADFGPENVDTIRRDLRRDINRESVDWTQTHSRNRIGNLTNLKSK